VRWRSSITMLADISAILLLHVDLPRSSQGRLPHDAAVGRSSSGARLTTPAG
jgi:hypothetical protein